MRVRGDGESSISIQTARFTHWNWMACSWTCSPAVSFCATLLTNRQTNSKNPTPSLRQHAVLTNIQALQSLRCFQRHGWNMTGSEQAAMLKMDITNSWLLPYYCSSYTSYSLNQTFSHHSVHKRGVILLNHAAPWQQTLKHSPQTFISFCLAELDSNLLRQSQFFFFFFRPSFGSHAFILKYLLPLIECEVSVLYYSVQSVLCHRVQVISDM